MDWLDPQQDVVRQGVQGGGGERGKSVRVGGGEQGVLVIVKIHRTFWWINRDNMSVILHSASQESLL